MPVCLGEPAVLLWSCHEILQPSDGATLCAPCKGDSQTYLDMFASVCEHPMGRSDEVANQPLGFFDVDFWGGEGAQVLAASCMLQSLLRSGPDNRGTLWVMRKVRAPQGRKLANGQAGRPDGKRRRKEDSRCLFEVREKLKRWCKRPPASWQHGGLASPFRSKRK